MNSKIKEVRTQLDHALTDLSNPAVCILVKLEEATGIDRVHLLAGSMCALGVWLVFGFAAQLVCNNVGFIYPAYASMRALEGTNKEEIVQWLTYWVVFASFSVIEFYADVIVKYFFFYWLIKCLFMIWLMLPIEQNGSYIVYRKFLRPLFLKHHDKINTAIIQARREAIRMLGEGLQKLEHVD